jgi:DNA helicase-2/ATP-dependent DNA helicase PcrA
MNRPSYLPSYLTDQQLEAILHLGSPLLIIAGPGSGKTEVITWRVAHLVRAGHVEPNECLVTTFTNKAAYELKDRIQQKLPDIDVEQMQVCTIHSLCAFVLREYQRRSSLPRGFRILDEDGQFLFVYTNRKALGLDALIKGRKHDFFCDVLKMFNLATEELVAPEHLLDWCHQQRQLAEERAVEAAQGKSKTKAQRAANEVDRWCEEAIITESYTSYCELLRERGLVDFGFLQRKTLDLLEANPDLVTALRGRYSYILVDEYQDTNAAQEGILRLMADKGERLSVVGDDDQSIYRFRGATVKNILTFKDRYPGARIVRLTENFRSREPIVQHSLNVIAHNPERFSKELFTMRGSGSDILLVYEHSVSEEAAATASLLRRLYDAGKIRQWSDVAMLLRSVRSYAGEYLSAFQTEGIPAYVTGDGSFFERDDVRQLYDLFIFLGATKAWADIRVRCTFMRLTEKTCTALKDFKENLLDFSGDDDLREIGVSDVNDRKKLLDLLSLKRRVLEKKNTSLLEVFYDLLAITEYVARHELIGDVESLMNLGVMSHLVSAFDQYASTRRIYPLQTYLQLMREGGVEPAVVIPEDAVQVMTIHQAKGLEFPVVVVGSVMDGRLPARSRRDRYEVPHDLRASGRPEVEDPHLVDERKLFYVAATRARELLILGTSDIVNKRGGGPSPFLTEMFGNDLRTAADLSRARVEKVETRIGRSSGPRERLSFSELAYFLQCPGRFRFAILYGLEVPRPDPVGYGANVHRALQAIHERAREGEPPSRNEVRSIVEEMWVSALQADPAQDEEAKKAAIEQLERYVKQYAHTFDKIVAAELSFSFGTEQHVLSGRIDLVRRCEDVVEIVDFKAGHSVEPALEQVDTQLDLYALGAEINRGLRVKRQTVHFLGDDRVYSWVWSPQKATSAQERIQVILDHITRRDFPPRREYCSRCHEFLRICPYARS